MILTITNKAWKRLSWQLKYDSPGNYIFLYVSIFRISIELEDLLVFTCPLRIYFPAFVWLSDLPPQTRRHFWMDNKVTIYYWLPKKGGGEEAARKAKSRQNCKHSTPCHYSRPSLWPFIPSSHSLLTAPLSQQSILRLTVWQKVCVCAYWSPQWSPQTTPHCPCSSVSIKHPQINGLAERCVIQKPSVVWRAHTACNLGIK